ncbi:hypothetical protein B0X71_08800 [Planococcus lenghuensis]|uniref:Uncharacterized protein n=2 Tax=Planococcus lenghuensis TaxID=2213202 RepID=A0A1Q2KYJ7_9BACL|nr:hypothetical protein B0X71_08800 [Planococcus lenghuensis]
MVLPVKAVTLTEKTLSDIMTAFIRNSDLQTAKTFVSEKDAGSEKLLNRMLNVDKFNAELTVLEKERASQQSLIEKMKMKIK